MTAKLPFNPCSATHSELEVLDGDTIVTLDPARAHEAAGDPDFEAFVETCGTCQAKALSQKALKEAIIDQSKR